MGKGEGGVVGMALVRNFLVFQKWLDYREPFLIKYYRERERETERERERERERESERKRQRERQTDRQQSISRNIYSSLLMHVAL